jgi:sugar lactone lactonase YvrE
VHGEKLYFVDSETSSLRVLEEGKITTLIGTGLFDFGYEEGKLGEGLMQHALGVHADDSGVYITDSYNHSIRRYDPETGYLYHYAGNGERGNAGGALSDARFNEPNDIVRRGNAFYIADTNNHRIRVLDITKGEVSELNLIPKMEMGEIRLEKFLPNTEITGEQTLAKGEGGIMLSLQEGWKINEKAPSYLALFKNDELVKSWMLDEVATKQVNASLDEGEYRLQGTLYYCEDKDGAVCLIKSVDLSLKAGMNGENSLTLPLN